MIQKIKDLDFKDFLDVIDEISKDLTKEFEKENKYSKEYNIYEENGFKHYEFMLPGFEKEDIRVELNHTNEIVVTTSKKKLTRQYTEKNVKSTKMFKVQLPSELINDSIKTHFNNGVLTLSFKAQNNPKIIKIN
jgi:HSP20 family molecular chaperone IbpA